MGKPKRAPRLTAAETLELETRTKGLFVMVSLAELSAHVDRLVANVGQVFGIEKGEFAKALRRARELEATRERGQR